MGYPAGYPGSCADCGTRREVSGTYEAALCPLCDEWQTPSCRDAHCAYCPDRPTRPSQAGDLDLAPHEVHPSYDLDAADDAELLRRVVLPVVTATLPEGSVRAMAISRLPGSPQEHWPRDVPWPDNVLCDLTLTSGEVLSLYLEEVGWVDPHALAEELADRLTDEWSESHTGWGQRITGGSFDVPPGTPPHPGQQTSG